MIVHEQMGDSYGSIHPSNMLPSPRLTLGDDISYGQMAYPQVFQPTQPTQTNLEVPSIFEEQQHYLSTFPWDVWI